MRADSPVEMFALYRVSRRDLHAAISPLVSVENIVKFFFLFLTQK